MGAAEDARRQREDAEQAKATQKFRAEATEALRVLPKELKKALAHLALHEYPSNIVGAPPSQNLLVSGEEYIAWTLVSPDIESERMSTYAHEGYYLLGDGTLVRRESSYTPEATVVTIETIDWGYYARIVNSLEQIQRYEPRLNSRWPTKEEKDELKRRIRKTRKRWWQL